MQTLPADPGFRRAVRWVAVANLLYFGVEFAAARLAGSVSLFADSIDFLEDASVNFLILAALNWPARRRAQVGMVLAFILLAPAIATWWTAWRNFVDPHPPEPFILSLTGLGALGVNVGCAFALARFRRAEGSLSRAAFLSARNDALANVAIIAAGLVTFAAGSIWPDLIVGLGIAAINAGAAHEVWSAAREEQKEADLHAKS
jgi:Co/Zn/Cd efflux system component